MIKNSIIILLLLLTTVFLQAQTVCKGTVVSLAKQPIANASVLIKNQDDHILQFGFTNTTGAFSITTETEGEFVVEVNKMGFIKQQQPLQVTKNIKEYNLAFILDENTETLEDLVIEIDNPI